MDRTWSLHSFKAHASNVNCLAMGHRSAYVLATGGDDRKVNLWAVGRKDCLMSLGGHSSAVECVRFTSPEDAVCAGEQRGDVRMWDLEMARPVCAMSGHRQAVKCIDFHPYGDCLATGSCDSQLKLWDTRQRAEVATFRGHRMAVNAAQFSPDGQWIASAGEEGSVLVWDVRTGRSLEELRRHAGSVSCVRFHPHEFLLASCSDDGTVVFWDVEKFRCVSATERMHSPVRHLRFSDDGACLLAAGAQGLTALGWEPARRLDRVEASWGQIHDMTLAQDQLIVGWFHSSEVVLNAVRLSSVHPFGGPAPSEPVIESSPFRKSASARKSFSRERPRPPLSAARRGPPPDRNAIEEESPPEPLPDRAGAFRANRSLNRTPPPSAPSPPARPTSESPDPPSPPRRPAPLDADGSESGSPTSLRRSDGGSDTTRRDAGPLRRQRSECEVKRVSGGGSSGVPGGERSSRRAPLPRSHSFSKPPRTADVRRERPAAADRSRKNPPVEGYADRAVPAAPTPDLLRRELTPSPEFVPITADRPIGLDLDEFLPKSKSGHGHGRGELSEQEALSVMMRDHASMMAVLSTRQRALQVFHSMWMSKNLKAALESTVGAGDLAVVLDILNVITLRPSIWNLDMCAILLPQIKLLLQSKYESYMTTGCSALRLILRNFASVIASNVRAAGIGIDISREERTARCRKCRDDLLEISHVLLTRRPNHPRLTAAFADLQTTIEQSIQ